MSLPALTGSPKQITWAESIRANILPTLVRDLDQATEVARPKAELALRFAQRQTASAWWIDHRAWADLDRVSPMVTREGQASALVAKAAYRAHQDGAETAEGIAEGIGGYTVDAVRYAVDRHTVAGAEVRDVFGI